MKEHHLGVVGLGYVGLPLAMEFWRAGETVIGVDVDKRRVAELLRGESPIQDISSEMVAEAIQSGRFIPTTDYSLLRGVESVSICVPTPLGKSHDPDISYVVAVCESIVPHLERGQLIVLESTVYPGATEELAAPILERSGLIAGKDFHLAFSPERIDPGNKQYTVSNIPKVVGGMTPESTRRAVEVYGRVFPTVLQLDSPKEAEMAKLLENTFRAVNIGLVNELAVMAHGMGINIWKVIEAASSKPFGFMPFYPGPGWGGHCIPVDPFYLSWRARVDGFEIGFVDQAGRINTRMPMYVIQRVTDLLNTQGKCLQGAQVLVLGVAYKRNVSDVRESPALTIIEQLVRRGVEVTYHDPYVPRLTVLEAEWTSQPLDPEMLANQDCVIIVTDHSSVDYEAVAQHSQLVFDTRNATASLRDRYPQISVL
jgi:UDP-N-acetyl-D-glucosamine dehydrogenase